MVLESWVRGDWRESKGSSGVLVLFRLLACELVKQVCSFSENKAECIICILYVNKRF